jgi:ubiquinone/menaquinone biosynthesis C-methylase UbiE
MAKNSFFIFFTSRINLLKNRQNVNQSVTIKEDPVVKSSWRLRMIVPSNRFQFERTRLVREFLYREAKIAKYSSILDIGAGDLKIAGEIAEKTRQPVYALDLVRPEIIPADVTFVAGRVEDLPFHDGSFDIVTASFLFLWIKDIPRVLREVKRILKREGLLLILSEPNWIERNDDPGRELTATLKRAMRELGANMALKKSLGEALENAGFKTRLYQTDEWARIDDINETLEEMEFMFSRGMISAAEKEKLINQEAGFPEQKVFLPIVYGSASL